ncbi:FAD-dependent oxidoreductase [Paenibacillus allorhizosphaerae]|uniref:FAD-dependent urate hydroxylase n=1 Tax=Paenibacillus allorhizosphaerae TaxID=2849866 RepID=A0ABM8V9L0_9BACL|nr:NAD(P)/FAD-dependent oxidoreductase [Paenibacillus allorhizosphaerae]CAG7613663.1 FAD-dependent urate hydroxylase [Paenibacillus allorhizosphaerae]
MICGSETLGGERLLINTFKVIIIGAGTGGLCLAHGLKRAGIHAEVYERDRTRTGGLQGYRVGISPDGSRALKKCLLPELFDIFVATCARTPKYFNMLTERYTELLSLELESGSDPVNDEKSVSRMTLRQVLLTGLEDIVHFDKKFSRYAQNADGTVTAFFEDGTSATGDLLVGADGANSPVRKQFLPHAKLEETGIVSIGGKLPITDETKALLPHKVFHGVTMVMAPKAYGCILHAMEFKWDHSGIKHGIGGNDAELLTRWPGLLYDNTRDYISWGFWASRRSFAENPLQIKDGEHLKRIVLEMTESWHPHLREIVRMSDPTAMITVNIRTSVPIEPWPTSNVTLIGDAIHTMTPGRGVGANTALRDAALLCQRMIEARDGIKPLKQAVNEYEAEMIRYGFEAVLDSRKQMDDNTVMHKPVIGRIALACMRTGMRLVNCLPPVKKKMAANLSRSRGAQREEVS